MTKTLAACGVLGALAMPQTFRSTVEGVRVDVRVEAGGRPVAGLTVSDFELRDSGVPQTIESATLEDVPLAVTLALDISASVAGEELAQLKRATGAAIATFKPEDRAALLTFAQAIRRPAAFTADRAVLAAAIGSMSAAGGTSMYDAAYAALTIRDDRAGRSLVLLFTDGADTTSWLPASAVLDAARRSDAVVYAIGLKNAPDPSSFRADASARLPLSGAKEPNPDRFLRDLANVTGGDVFYADTSRDLSSRFVAIVREFKNRYLLTYTPAGVDRGGWHPIDVKVKRPGAKVTARRGYQK